MINKVATVGVLALSAGLGGFLTGCSNDGSKEETCQACSCFKVTDDNIVNWTEIAKFNTCCLSCVLDELDCTPGDNSDCTYANAKAAFQECGSADWPPNPPTGFEPP